MSYPFQHTKTPYDILDPWEHDNGNSEDDGYWTFMGSPFYDSLRPSSIVSIRCSKKEQLDEVIQVETKFDIVWYEDISVTLRKHDEDMIDEYPME